MTKKDILNILDDLSNNSKFKVKNTFVFENNKRIVFKQHIDSKDRFIYVKHINELLKDSDIFTHIELMTMRSSKDYCFKINGFDKLIYVHVKPIGKRSKVNCHEFLTAALVLMGISFVPNNEKEINDIYNCIETIINNNKIKNYSMKEVNCIEYDYTSLCQAASASKSILNMLEFTPEIAYLTGTNHWDEDIKELQYIHNNIKNYNSSDIIFKKDNNFTGISLKRKEFLSHKDPPLINKSLLNLFNYNLEVKEEISAIISSYFIDILNQFEQQNIIDIHCNKNNWKKQISNIDLNVINEKIKNDKCILWKNIRSVIFKHSESICADLINHILRIELLKVKDFNFNMVTGIGRYKKAKGFIVENGECISLNRINEVYEKYIKDKKYKILRNKEKESSYQSTLFMTIFSDNIPIINLEIRYKGCFHTSPQILAFFSKEFKEMIFCKNNK